MKKLSLSIGQRIQLVSFLNSLQNKSYESLVEIWKLIDKTKLSESERKDLNIKIDNNLLTWDVLKAKDKEVEITPEEEKEFNEEFEKYSKEKKLEASQYNLAQVYAKLKELK